MTDEYVFSCVSFVYTQAEYVDSLGLLYIIDNSAEISLDAGNHIEVYRFNEQSYMHCFLWHAL